MQERNEFSNRPSGSSAATWMVGAVMLVIGIGIGLLINRQPAPIPVAAPLTTAAAPSVAAPAPAANPASPVNDSSAPALESVTPSAPATSSIKAILALYGSGEPFSVSLNGQKVGDFSAYLQQDVGQYLKPGSNTLQVAWSQGTKSASAKVAVFDNAKNDYSDKAKIQVVGREAEQPGQRTVSFNVP